MSDSTLKRMASLSLPIIASNLMLPLVGAVDTAMMGHQADSLLIGAAAVGSSIFTFILWSFGFLRMSTGGLVAKAWGAQDGASLRAHFVRASSIALFLGFLVILLHPWLIAVGLKCMPMQSNQEPYAQTYLQIRLLSGPVTLFHYVLMGMLIGMQSTRSMFIVQLIFNGTNLLLDIVTVYGFGMGIEGIAWASVISECIAVGWAVFFVLHKLKTYAAPYPDRNTLLNPTRILSLLKVNFDILVRTQVLLLCFLYFTSLGTQQSAAILAANALLLKLMEFVVFALDGFAHASETLTGEAIGRSDVEQLKRTVYLGRVLSISVALLAIPILGLGSAFWLSLLTHHQHIIDTALRYMPWVCLAPLVSVLSYQYDGVFIGAVCSKEMRNSMLLSAALFFLATQTLLPLWGNHGLWVALLVLNATRGVSLHLWLPRVYAKAHTHSKTIKNRSAVH